VTDIEERYIHFASCLEWLNESWNLLQLIRSHPSEPLAGPAFRFALVLYAKPYRESRGTAVRKLRLDTSFIPPEYLRLHEEILNERDQLHAHSDISVMDAILTVHELEGRNHAVMVRKHIDPTRLFARMADVVSLIEGTLDRMYVEARTLESQLPN
jgi:hypothetical protein